jgi:hypothetical protein
MNRHVKVGHIMFVKECAKDMTLTEFKKQHDTLKDAVDLDEAYEKCGGKKSKKATEKSK